MLDYVTVQAKNVIFFFQWTRRLKDWIVGIFHDARYLHQQSKDTQ